MESPGVRVLRAEDLITEIPQWIYGLFPDQPLMFLRTPEPMCGPWVYKQIGRAKGRALRVICTGGVEADHRRWLHVSYSKPECIPDWEDTRLVKDTFIGRDRKALQILPPEAEYVNFAPHCLHLWSCIDGDVVPDFRKHGMI